MGRPKFLFYHDVRHSACELPPKCYGPTLEDFRIQAAYLKQNYELLDAETLTRCARQGRFPARCAAIMFDDGLEGVYHACGVLSEMNIPAIVFISTRFIESDSLPWFVLLDDLLNEAARQHKKLVWLDAHYDPANPGERMICRSKAKIALLTQKYEDQVRSLGSLAEQLQIDLAGVRRGRQTFLTWDQISQLRDAGFHIGSHTHSHVDLRVLDEAELEREFSQSVEALRRHLGAEHDSLVSYPDGRFNDNVKRMAGKYHCLAFATRAKTSWNDPYRLPRRGVSRGGVESLKRSLSPWMPLRWTVSRLVKKMQGQACDGM